MYKLLSRKFCLLLITYAVFIVFFALGYIGERWFCGSLLAMSFFYYIANVWQKAIENYTPDIDAIVDMILTKLGK